MTQPRINERHVARGYRSVALPTNLWSAGASGGGTSGGTLLQNQGEEHYTYFPLPWELDPGYTLWFRLIASALDNGALGTYVARFTTDDACTIPVSTPFTHGGFTYTTSPDNPVVAGYAGMHYAYIYGTAKDAVQALVANDVLTPVTPIAGLVSVVVMSVEVTQQARSPIEVQLQVIEATPGGEEVVWEGLDASTFNSISGQFEAATPPSEPGAYAVLLGSHALSSATGRGRGLAMRLYNMGNSQAYTLSLEVAYVPLYAGILGVNSVIAKPWA